MKNTFLLILFATNYLFAQDTIYFANKKIYEVKVLNMSNSATRFSIFNNDSLQFDVRNKAIDSIKFSNGKILKPREISYLNKKPINKREYKLQEFNAKHVVYLDLLNLTVNKISVGYLFYFPNKRVILDFNTKFSVSKYEKGYKNYSLGFQILSAERRKSALFLEPILGYIVHRDAYSYNNKNIASIYTQLNIGGNFYSGNNILIAPFLGLRNYWGDERRYYNELSDFMSVGIKLGYKIK